jgi:TRAP-type C4-dicarboxylate transport system substrate-binding protein
MKGKNLLVILLIMSLVLVGGLSGCSQPSDEPSGGDTDEPSGETYEFSIAHLQSAGSAGADALTYLGEILEERTEGRIKVNIYGDKSMAGGDTELGEIVRQNTVQLVPVPTHTLSAISDIPEYKVFELPYLFNSWDDIYTVLDSDIAKEWSKTLEEDAGLVVYDGLVKGWLSIGTDVGPIESPDDLAGRKIRTMSTDMQMGLIESFGANPTIVSYGELYTAKQQGTVDGILTATSLYYTDKFAEVIDHLSIIRATAHFHIPVVNKEWLDTLPNDLRSTFDECMRDYVLKARELEKQDDTEMKKLMESEMGVQVKEYTDDELQPFRAATKSMWDEYYDAPGEGVVEDVLELLDKDYESIFE